VSICIYCGQDHGATVRVCPKTGKAIGTAESSQKTLFGVGSAPVPPIEPSRKQVSAPVSLPPPKPVPAGNQSSALALGKTMFGVAPAPASSKPVPAPPSKPVASPARPAAPTRVANPRPAPTPRLPTEQEARDNPDLVITLDLTPAPASAPPPVQGPVGTPVVQPAAVFAEAPIDLPSLLPSDFPGPPGAAAPTSSPGSRDSQAQAAPAATTDLPPVGMGRRFVLPDPQDPPTIKRARPATGARLADRLMADARNVLTLLAWALGTYLRAPKPLLLLAAFLIVPASVVQSCALAGIAPGTPASTLAANAGTVDFSKLKAELAARVHDSQLRGEMDKQAAAELAALTSVEAARVPVAPNPLDSGSTWLWSALALLVEGLLLFGLAFPIACGTLAIAVVDEQRGARVPVFADIWPILFARSELIMLSLVPAALLTALGYALFVIPGLIASVSFLFVPHVVLFEKKDGRAALSRSIELVRRDATRVVLTFLAFALAGFATTVVTDIAFSVSGSRAVMFLRFLVGDLLVVAVFPIPALALARIYLESRSRAGATPERLAQAVRS
jgi:hypothetical protein